MTNFLVREDKKGTAGRLASLHSLPQSWFGTKYNQCPILGGSL